MAGATGVRMFAVDQLKTTASPAPGPDADAVARHRELILEIRALRSAIEQREGGTRRLTSHPAQLGGIHRLRHELDLIHAAIAATKQDVEALQSSKLQDVAGRRVAKVVATLKFIADHIVNVMEISGGNEAARAFPSATIAERRRDRLASAPRERADPGQASPYDIDALLA
jgi:hypothetical protein